VLSNDLCWYLGAINQGHAHSLFSFLVKTSFVVSFVVL